MVGASFFTLYTYKSTAPTGIVISVQLYKRADMAYNVDSMTNKILRRLP